MWRWLRYVPLVLGPFVLAQESAHSLLSPSRRLSSFTATTYLPNSFVSVANLNPQLSLNFSAGQLLIGDHSVNVKNLVSSRLYLGASSETDLDVFSVVWKTKKGQRTGFGAKVNVLVSAKLDRDFLRIATEGILPEGFGEEVVDSKGIDVNAHVFSEVYVHKVRTLGRTNFGYRVRLVTPIAGAQLTTPEFKLTRTNNGSANELALSYEFVSSYYGFDPQNIQAINFSPSDLVSKNTSLLFDLGIEQELSNKLKLGVLVKGMPGSTRFEGAAQTTLSGSVSYTGPQFTIGRDSLSAVLGQLVNFDLDSLLPQITENNNAQIQIPLNPILRIYGHRYLSEESILSLALTSRPSIYGNDLWTSFYIYSRSNKLFHISYGLNWWTNNNSVDVSLAGRLLLAPYTRLTVGMSNPFLLPRIGSGSAILVPENFTGFSLSVGLSFGLYKGEEL